MVARLLPSKNRKNRKKPEESGKKNGKTLTKPEEKKRQISDFFVGLSLPGRGGFMFWAGGTLGGNPRGGIPPGTLGTGTWERGGSMLSDSPSLNVALREIGITFLGFLLLSLPNSPSLNIALWESRFAFFDHINNQLLAFRIESSIRARLWFSQPGFNLDLGGPGGRIPPGGSPRGDPPVI